MRTAAAAAPARRSTLELLIERARAIYGEVQPCTGKTWETSISHHRGKLMFWFNDPTGSTRVISL